MFVALVSLASLALYGVAIHLAWRAINTARTPQGAVGWVVFLLSSPFLAVFLYLFFGHHRYRNYLVARRYSERVISAARSFAERFRPKHPPDRAATRAFEEIAAISVTGGNSARLLVDGAETFEALFAAIDAAEHYILAQFFILHDDDIGRAFRDRLVAAARRGAHVRLLIDPIGSRTLPHQFLDPLREAGADVPTRRALRKRAGRLQINYRNHRKTLIVDGVHGFTGGLNVGDEYLGRDPGFGHWRDTFVALTGPMVPQLQLVFSEDWHWATGESLIGALHWEPRNAPQDMPGLIVATGPADDMGTGSLFFLSALVMARQRIWIASPYFVPDAEVLGALKQAALRGVEVRLLVPEAIDHTLPWLAAHAYFDECRAAGVEIWRYRDGFLHQKVILVDDTMAAIGTMNMDNRSFYLNFELMAVLFDARAAGETAAMLEADFKKAVRLETALSDMSLKIRAGAPVSRLFAPLL